MDEITTQLTGVWSNDIFYKEKSPSDLKEVALIKRLTFLLRPQFVVVGESPSFRYEIRGSIHFEKTLTENPISGQNSNRFWQPDDRRHLVTYRPQDFGSPGKVSGNYYCKL